MSETLAADALPQGTHPLVAALVTKHGATRVDAASLPAFAARARRTVLVFTEDPVRYRETLDLAVIVPELVRAFPGQFALGVLLPEDARSVAPRYAFRRWPALVVLLDGDFVGAVDGLRNWDEYVRELRELLVAPAKGTHAIGIPIAVVAANR